MGIEVQGGIKIAFQELRPSLPARVVVHEYGVERDTFTRARPWIAQVENG